MMSGIRKTPNGQYAAFVSLQDGTENLGVHATVEEARAALAKAESAYNRNKLGPENIPVIDGSRDLSGVVRSLVEALAYYAEDAERGERARQALNQFSISLLQQ